MLSAAGADEKWLLRAGGISALAIGAAYLVIIALYVPMGPPPAGVETRLAYLGANTKSWWTILWLSVLTDFLFVPVALSLYFALQTFHRSAMLLATACVLLFVVLDLAITWTNYAALVGLGGKYVRATNDIQRSIVITAAEYPCEMLQSTLLFVYNTLTLAVGILISGVVMRRGPFSKATSWLGIATGILGLLAVFGPLVVSALSATIIITSVLTTIWLFFVGRNLCRLGQA